MSDPRNAAHDKKVSQEKKHQHAEPAAGAEPTDAAESPLTTPSASPEAIAIHEASLVVLSKLKDMEFHSRANLERLAEMLLTVEDELKQKAFVEPLGEIFSLQDTLQTKLTALIAGYKAESDSMPGAAA